MALLRSSKKHKDKHKDATHAHTALDQNQNRKNQQEDEKKKVHRHHHHRTNQFESKNKDYVTVDVISGLLRRLDDCHKEISHLTKVLQQRPYPDEILAAIATQRIRAATLSSSIHKLFFSLFSRKHINTRKHRKVAIELAVGQFKRLTDDIKNSCERANKIYSSVVHNLSQSQASVHPAPPTPEQAPQNPSTLSSSCMEVVQIERKLVQVDSRTYQRDARKQVKQLQALANDVCQMFKYLEDLVQSQAHKVSLLEDNIIQSKVQIKKGKIELQEANSHKQKMRFAVLGITAIGAIFGALAGGPIGAAAGSKAAGTFAFALIGASAANSLSKKAYDE